MAPEVPLTRRSLLASGVCAGAGLVGVGQFHPTWLPDFLTDWWLERSPEPPATVWEPTVSEAHADAAVTRLADTVERAIELQQRIDVDDLPQGLRFHLDSSDPSGGWLGTAREESDPAERLWDATYGMQFAGETVGYGEFVLDEVDTTAIVERGDRLHEDIASVRTSLDGYPVSDPATDLASLFFVELELAIAHLASRGYRRFAEDDAEDYSDSDVADVYGGHLTATQYLADAEHYRGLYRDGLGDSTRSYAAALDAAVEELTGALEPFPTRDEVETRLVDERGLRQDTPYGAARLELYWTCFDYDHVAGFDAGGYREGHTVQRVVELAWALLDRRAHEFAVSELDVSPEATDYDSGRALQAKRRATRRFESWRADHDSPFAGVLAQRAADIIRAGDVSVSVGGDDDRPAWQDRVEATTYFLVGLGYLHELDDVLDVVV